MQPKLAYVQTARMEDGSEPNFTIGQEYEINCAFNLDGDTHISVVDNTGDVHHFDITEEWFSQSFVVDGDLETVWEEV
tara:strand:+ start:834 stop:1067 length:234 start_codon:yes stop_codon:yes gene_type:complete